MNADGLQRYEAQTVGEIVAADYRTAEVFQKYGIDFCCGGNKPVTEACRERGVSIEVIARDLEQAAQEGSPTQRYNEWSLDFLADYIVNQHHAYTKKMIPQIREFAGIVAEVHGDSHPETCTIAKLWHEVSGELAKHMQKEELLLFPYIKQLIRSEQEGTPPPAPRFGSARELIQAMEDEHQFTGDQLGRLAELSDHYTPPQDACNTYRALYGYLKEIDAVTKEHVHLENNILFPKTIRLEEKLTNGK